MCEHTELNFRHAHAKNRQLDNLYFTYKELGYYSTLYALADSLIKQENE